MPSFAHVTDPHYGRADPSALAALQVALREADPDVVVWGGDMTHRAKRGQFLEVRAMLDALPMPWIAIPGNHDVPLHNVFARVFSRLGGFHRHITRDRAPLYIGDGLRILGLDSTRRKVVGRLKEERLPPIAKLVGGEPDDLRVLVTHHPLVRKPLENAKRVLDVASKAGVEVCCAGHHHNVHILPAPPTDILCVESPSPSHILEPIKGFHVISATPAEITVQLWSFDGISFSPTGQPHVKPRNETLTRL